MRDDKRAISAARLKRARRRLLWNLLGSGVVMAALYVILAAFVIRFFGVEVTRYWSTLALAAGVMLGGTYGIVMFAFLLAHVARRILSRRPIMDDDG